MADRGLMNARKSYSAQVILDAEAILQGMAHARRSDERLARSGH